MVQFIVNTWKLVHFSWNNSLGWLAMRLSQWIAVKLRHTLKATCSLNRLGFRKVHICQLQCSFDNWITVESWRSQISLRFVNVFIRRANSIRILVWAHGPNLGIWLIITASLLIVIFQIRCHFNRKIQCFNTLSPSTFWKLINVITWPNSNAWLYWQIVII